MPMYQRPAFWRVPHQRPDPDDEVRHSQRKLVTPGTPAARELARGDIVAKIDDYDARDLRHEDAQNLFRNAPNQIKLVVQRSSPSSHLYTMPRSPNSFSGRSLLMPTSYRMADAAERAPPPRSPLPRSAPPPFRNASPLPAQQWRGPESLPRSAPVLPQTQFVPQQEGDFRTLMMSSAASNRTDESVDESIQSQGAPGDAVRDRSLDDTSAPPSDTMAGNPNFFPNGYQDPKHPEEEVVTNWPYRTTPLVLPGAKVRREPGPTQSYLRHHPSPAVRAPPHHDYRDTLMRQKVAESVVQRVIGEDSNKVVHKQFNSPINLYSEQNIANSIRQQTSPLPSNGYYGRPRLVKSPPAAFDPAQSHALRALHAQDAQDARDARGARGAQEHSAPSKLFEPGQHKRPAPIPKPVMQPETNLQGKQTTFVSSLQEEHIQQSSSFKRLMHHVLADAQA